MKLFWLLILTLLSSCSTQPPNWTDATPKQREEMDYRIDDNYLDSQQFTNDMNEDVDVIMNLKHKMGKK